MTNEMRSWGRILTGYKWEEGMKKGESEKRVLTLNFLHGGLIGVGSEDSNLDFQASPPTSEKSIDLRADEKRPGKPSATLVRRQIQDLNLPPIIEGDNDNNGAAPLSQGSALLDLNLVTPAPVKHCCYFTVEIVKVALERTVRESGVKPDRRRMDGFPSSSLLSSAATNSSIKRCGDEKGVDSSDWILGSLMAARCPNCLFYVMVPWLDPLCPNCGSHVPVPVIYKKPRVRF